MWNVGVRDLQQIRSETFNLRNQFTREKDRLKAALAALDVRVKSVEERVATVEQRQNSRETPQVIP